MRTDFIALALLAAQTASARDRAPAPSTARIVAIGDSIMWGQGLAHADKFATRVVAEYAEASGRKTTLDMQAHSGATLADHVNDSLKSLANADGEVPRHTKSVASQLRDIANPDEVDILLVDGCINDVSPTNLVLRNLKDAQASYWKAQATEKCLGPMTTLLNQATRHFRNAVIVVTGYYPLFVKSVDDTSSKGFLFGNAKKKSAIANEAAALPDALLAKIAAWACASGNPQCVAGLLLNKQELRSGLALKSQWWVDESNKALRKAVDDANASLRKPRVAFAPVRFGPGDGMGQANSKLWNFGQVDPQFFHRTTQCKEARNKEPNLDLHDCVAAAVFHPNAAGAKLYSQAVTAALRTLGAL